MIAAVPTSLAPSGCNQSRSEASSVTVFSKGRCSSAHDGCRPRRDVRVAPGETREPQEADWGPTAIRATCGT